MKWVGKRPFCRGKTPHSLEVQSRGIIYSYNSLTNTLDPLQNGVYFNTKLCQKNNISYISTPDILLHLLYIYDVYIYICFFVWAKNCPGFFCRFSSQGTALEQQKEPEGFPRFLPAADCNPWMKPAGRWRLGFSSVFFSSMLFFSWKALIIFGADLNLLFFSYDELMGVIYSSWKILRVEVVMDWHGMKGSCDFCNVEIDLQSFRKLEHLHHHFHSSTTW